MVCFEPWALEVAGSNPADPTDLGTVEICSTKALTCGMNPVIVEWFMGHDIGIAKHYLADNIKQEYAKFESRISLITPL